MIGYLILAFLWSAFAVRQQIEWYGWTWWRLLLVAVLNFVACPLCMIFAIVRGAADLPEGIPMSTLKLTDPKFKAEIYDLPGRTGVGLKIKCPCAPDCPETIKIGFQNPQDNGMPDPDTNVRWKREGTTLDDLTLSPSVLGCKKVRADGKSGHPTGRWHGWIKDGEVIPDEVE